MSINFNEEKANFDTTYCTSKECKNKCWRHENNYTFDAKQNYWFQEACAEQEITNALRWRNEV